MISNSKGNDYCVISYLSDMRISKESYERLKSVFHPKIRKNIERFKQENYYIFPSYHGCGKRNRNGVNKKINYAIGEMCNSPTYKLSLKPMHEIKWEHLPTKIYWTRNGARFGMNNFAKCKGMQWFDWDKKQYFEKRLWLEIERKHYDSVLNQPWEIKNQSCIC